MLGAKWPRLSAVRKPSLRTRLWLWVAALVLVAVTLFGSYIYIDTQQRLKHDFDDSLVVSATLTASTVRVSGGTLGLEESLPENDSELEALRLQENTIRYIDAHGSLIGGFGSLWDSPPEATSLAAARSGVPAYSDYTDPATHEDYRAYTLPLLDSGAVTGFVQVIHSVDQVASTLGHLLAALLAGGAAATIGAGLAGYFLAKGALAPIDEITRTARRISAQDLSARLKLSRVDDEVGRLASTFDEMLERLEQSFQRERQFAADASHELRTPLAAMEAILGVMRSERREAAEYEQSLDDLADETARLRHLVERLLELARSGRSVAAESTPVDISTMVDDVADVMRPLAQANNLDLECRLETGLAVQGDGDSLIRLFLNLVENAIKFTERGIIQVSAFSQAGGVVVEVTDTGIGIAADRLPHIFERFYRADQSRSTPGAGLGLALAWQIVENHSGTLTARSREGEGSTFTVTLPSRPV
jgi:signal transduction histidine kinase